MEAPLISNQSASRPPACRPGRLQLGTSRSAGQPPCRDNPCFAPAGTSRMEAPAGIKPIGSRLPACHAAGIKPIGLAPCSRPPERRPGRLQLGTSRSAGSTTLSAQLLLRACRHAPHGVTGWHQANRPAFASMPCRWHQANCLSPRSRLHACQPGRLQLGANRSVSFN